MADLERGYDARASVDMSVDQSGTPVVRLAGELDISNAEAITALVEPTLTDETECLIVDVADLNFMDSSGVAVLLRWSKRVRRVELRNASRIIRRTVETMALTDILHLEP